MAKLVDIWRHPIKSHGREQLSEVALQAGQTLPWDRAWAVAHEESSSDGSKWVPCLHFSRTSKAPKLAAINAHWEEATQEMTLTHPDLSDLVFNPDDSAQQQLFLEWAGPLIPENRARSARLLRAQERGMTDTDYATISIGNLSSHRAVEQKMGRSLSPQRWRCNLWLDGLAPWEEFDWIGKSITIGDVEFDITEPVERCMATTANPETGLRDADTLGTLETWGHTNFTVYAVVKTDGEIRIGDKVTNP